MANSNAGTAVNGLPGEDGWTSQHGRPVASATCGDGKFIAGREAMATSALAERAEGTGCSAGMPIDPGRGVPAHVCHQTVWSATSEGGRHMSCDDQNLVPFDGCSPTPQKKKQNPAPSTGLHAAVSAAAVCRRRPRVRRARSATESQPGGRDGCDHTCKIEPKPGFDGSAGQPSASWPPAASAILVIGYMRYHVSAHSFSPTSICFSNDIAHAW